jgi:hypothetical protein
MRSVGAILAGLIVAGLVVSLGESLGHWFYPPPPDFDLTTEAGRAAVLAQAPFSALLAVIFAYAAGAFTGGLTAGRIAPAAKVAHALGIGFCLTLGGVYNLLSFPHPLWMAIATLVVFLPSSWIGGRLARS